MIVILIIIAVLFLFLLAWNWHNLGGIEKTRKVTYIAIGIIIVMFITFIIYNISKAGVKYENKDIEKSIQNILMIVFTIVNGYIVLPYNFKILDKIKNNEIEIEKIKKVFIIFSIIFLIISIIECNYLRDTQQNILKIMQNLKQ